MLLMYCTFPLKRFFSLTLHVIYMLYICSLVYKLLYLLCLTLHGSVATALCDYWVPSTGRRRSLLSSLLFFWPFFSTPLGTGGGGRFLSPWGMFTGPATQQPQGFKSSLIVWCVAATVFCGCGASSQDRTEWKSRRICGWTPRCFGAHWTSFPSPPPLGARHGFPFIRILYSIFIFCNLNIFLTLSNYSTWRHLTLFAIMPHMLLAWCLKTVPVQMCSYT